MSDPDLDNRFDLHPATEETGPVMDGFRAKHKELAEHVKANTYANREQSLAVTKLEEALFWANASVARFGPSAIETRTDAPEPSAPVTRAKFSLDTVDGNLHTFRAVIGGDDSIAEDQTFHKYTPSGTLQINIDNDVVTEKLEVGRSYYLDITEAPE